MRTYPCFEQNVGNALSKTYMGMSDDPNGFNAGSQITNTRKQLIKFFILKKKKKEKRYIRPNYNNNAELEAHTCRNQHKQVTFTSYGRLPTKIVLLLS